MVYVGLPEIRTTVKQGQPFGEIESTKAVNDLYAPLSGTVVERNDAPGSSCSSTPQVWLAFGRQDRFESPGLAEYALMAAAGVSIAIAVEWSALASGRWQYSARMPLLPGMSVGLTPVLQMLLLPPGIFYLVARLRPA